MGFRDEVRRARDAAEEAKRSAPEGASREEVLALARAGLEDDRARAASAAEAGRWARHWAVDPPYAQRLTRKQARRAGCDLEELVRMYVAVVGIPPADAYGLLPTHAEIEVTEVTVLYADRPRYDEGRARFRAALAELSGP